MKNSITFLLLLSSFICLVPEVDGADYYWVGNGGPWNEVSHWSTVSGSTLEADLHTTLPGPDDVVKFDGGSFDTPNQVVSLTRDASCKDFDWTNVGFTPKFRFSSGVILNIYGAISINSNIVVDFDLDNPGTIRMQSTSSSTFAVAVANGITLPNLEFVGDEGSWALTTNLNVYGDIIFNSGEFDAGAPSGTIIRNIIADRFIVNGSKVDLDISKMNITAKILFSIVDLNSFIYTVNVQSTNFFSAITTPLFQISTSKTNNFGSLNLTGANPVLNAGGQSIEFHQDVTLEGTQTNTVLGSHTFVQNLILENAGAITKLEAGSTQTFDDSGGIVGTNANCSNYYLLKSTVDGSAAFVSKPTGDPINLSRFYLQDIHAVEANQFTASLSVDLGNNDQWGFASTSSNNYYWVGGTGNWSDGSNWQIEGGSTGCLPTAVDNVFFDENSFDQQNQVVTVDIPAIYFNNMTWTDPKQMGNSDFPVWSIPSGDVYIGGSMELAPTMSVNSSGTLHFIADNGDQTITAADDNDQGFDLNEIIFDGAATWTLGGELSASASILLRAGTLNTSSSDHNIETALFSVDGTGTTLTLNESEIYSTTFEILSINSLNSGTSNIYTETFDITPDGLIFYELLLRGDEGILRGTNLNFRDVILSNDVKSSVFGSHSYSNLLQFDKPGMIVEFEGGSTQEMGDLESLGGDCGDELIYVRSSQSGSPVNFVATGGNISVSFIALQDNMGSPAMAFSASRSQDLGNNSGWDFSLSADTRYFFWRGGTGDWNDASNWVYATNLNQNPNQSGCIPTPSDDVTFDADSFDGPNQRVTLDGPEQYCRSMLWRGKMDDPESVTGLPEMFIPSGNSLQIFGGLTLAEESYMTVDFDNDDDAVLHFRAATPLPVHGIITSGQAIPNIQFEGSGGSWELNGGMVNIGNISLINGSLNTKDNAVSADQFLVDGSGVSLSLGGSNLDITTLFQINSINTFDAGTSRIETNVLTSIPVGLNFNIVQMIDIGTPDEFDSDPDTEINGSNIIFNSLILSGTGNNIVHGSNTFNQLLQFDYNSSYFPPLRTNFIFDEGSNQSFANAASIFSNSDNFAWPTLRTSSDSGGTATFTKNGENICLQFIRIFDIITAGTAKFGYNPTNALVSPDPDDLGWLMTSDCATFLPVDCTDFAAAVKSDNSVELYWITAQEINNSGFEVQRSTDGRRFETISWIEGAGTTSEAQKYTYTDLRTEGLTEAYYRLRQIDFDGTSAFACDIQAVNFRNIGDGPLQVFPNPANELIQVRWYGKKTGTTIIRLFDQSGRLILDREWSTLEGNNQRELPIQDLPKGIYELQLVSENGHMQATRMVKQ